MYFPHPGLAWAKPILPLKSTPCPADMNKRGKRTAEMKKDDEYHGENTRQFYRVEYPDADRPRLVTGERSYAVVNISEKGGRFSPEDKVRPDAGTPVAGTITFGDGEEVEIEGEVLRAIEDDVIICFTRRIHFIRIIKEQWRLMRKYRHLL